MKQFFKMFFASFFAVILAGVVTFVIIIFLLIKGISSAIDTKPKEVAIAKESVLHINLGQTIREVGEENSFALFNEDEDDYSAGMYDMLNAIKQAKDDDDITGIYLRLNPSPNGWATLQELRMAIEDFKQSGKFVYAYGEQITQSAYYVATVADSVFLNPVGDFELKGFATVLAFFKGSLDKLEIEPEIYYAGKFKSATEPFRAYKMSDANRKQIQEFQSDFWQEFSTAVAGYTHKTQSEINSLAQSGAIEFPEDALKHGLVNNLLYIDEVEQRLRSASGIGAKEKVKFVTIHNYAKKAYKRRSFNDNKIAVLVAEGEIVGGQSDDMYQVAARDFEKQIRKVKNNDDIKAVVLRVNSPGGSALASDMIWRELKLLAKEKKVVVSMGNVAASGGYYISTVADSIFVLPNTVTGSIGVFSILFSTEHLMKNKLGVTFDEVKTAPYADFPTVFRTMTPDEGAKIQRSVDNIYDIFKGKVAEGRNMSKEEVDEVAQGRVWTGTDALENGLADAIGGLNRAIESAAALSGVDDYQVVMYPKPKDRLDFLFKSIGKNTAKLEAAKAILEYEKTEEYQFLKKVKDLKRINGQTMMWLPYDLSIK